VPVSSQLHLKRICHPDDSRSEEEESAVLSAYQIVSREFVRPTECHVERSRSAAKRNSGGVETPLLEKLLLRGFLAPPGTT